MQNFKGLHLRGWSGQIASLTHESFCPFFSFLVTPTGRIFRHIPTLNVIMRRSRQGSAFWGLERLNLKFDPFTPKKRKNWDFKLAVYCCRPNSGTVSHITFKRGTRIDHPSGIT